jgi:sporulation protein YlmC with PRC-barrel domain
LTEYALRGGGRCRQFAASLVCVAVLSACRSTPPAVRSTGTGTGPVLVVQSPPPDVEALQPKMAGPSDVKIAVPPCVPEVPLPAPQPKPNPKPAPKETPAQQPSGAAVQASPGGVIDADVKRVGSSVSSILGKKVQSPKGEDLGRVVDVLADAGGRVQLAIIDFGGFLGLGNRRIAVDWALLHFDPGDQDKPLTLSLSRTELQRAPEYKDSAHPQALMVPSSAEGKK